MTQPLPPTYPPPAGPPVTPPPRPPRGRRWWARAAAVIVAALVLIGAGIGVGMAADSKPSAHKMDMSTHDTTKHAAGKKSGGKNGGKAKRGTKAVDPARQAWAHKYGVNRSTMPNLADAAASAQQRSAATDLLVRTEAATAPYADLAKARAAGYDLQAKLTLTEQKKPGLTKAMQRVDAAGSAAGGHMPMLHVGKKANKTDGKVLDPSAPETLMYGYQGHGHWMLMGVMYTAGESYPQAPPDPGGPITRWHYHDKSGGQSLMMHIFFVPGNDLAHAYAADMKS